MSHFVIWLVVFFLLDEQTRKHFTELLFIVIGNGIWNEQNIHTLGEDKLIPIHFGTFNIYIEHIYFGLFFCCFFYD